MKFLLIIAVFAGLVISGSVQSSEIKINQRFTGVDNPTAIDTNGDGALATSAIFQVTGSPGRSTGTTPSTRISLVTTTTRSRWG